MGERKLDAWGWGKWVGGVQMRREEARRRGGSADDGGWVDRVLGI